MEGAPRTRESDIIEFCVIAVETASRKMNIPQSELVRRLDNYGLIEGRLVKYYDLLHTQSKEYVADYLIETLDNYENGR